jgi:HK97 family phage portal protein
MSLLKEHAESKRILTKSALPDSIWASMIWGAGTLESPRWDRQAIIREAFEKNPPFFAAVNYLTNAIASIPLYVEVEVQGKIHRVDAHPILRTLNRNEPYRQFISRLAKYYITLGTTYGKIVEDSTGRRPLGVIVMPAQFVRNIQGTYMKPIRGYKYTETREEDIPVEKVIHAYAPSLSRYWEEISPAIPLAEIISLHNGAVTWNKNVVQKGGLPPMIAEVMTRSKQEIEKFKAWWQEQTGAAKSHEIKVVGEGTKFHNTAFKPNEAEWHQAIMTSMRIILMSLGVNSSLLNDAANKTYNNVHDARKGLYEEGAIPILEILLEAITHKLQPYYADNPVLRIDKAKIEPIQEDRKMAIDRIAIAVNTALMTENEGRAELGLPPGNGPTSDLLIRTGMTNNLPQVAGGNPVKEPTENDPEPELDEEADEQQSE